MEYLIALIVSLIINIALFFPAYFLKTDKLTDFSYGLSFFLVVLFLFLNSEIYNLQNIILFSLITLWSIRIGTYLLIRIIKTKSDKRFDGIREKFWNFLGFWILQAVTVFIILLPTISFLNKNTNNISDNFAYSMIIGLIGTLIALFGLIFETIADHQKFIFKNNLENKDAWIESGLWKYSRHPNYFGEIVFWFGIFVFCISNGISGTNLIGIISPLYIFILLRFVSGIPPLEKKYIEKYANNEKYEQYKNKTNLLVPNFKAILASIKAK